METDDCNGTDCTRGYLWPQECPDHCDPKVTDDHSS
jgi:hypothetical protein